MFIVKQLTYIVLFALLTGCAASRISTTSSREQKQYVVILSMDAFRWDLASRSHTPTLDSLARVGTQATLFPVYPSNTFPCHYSMATGLHPDHHGVVNNTFYDKQLDRKLVVFDSLDVRTPGFWGGEPIWNTVERQGLKANIFMWPGSEVPINGRQASVWTRYSKRPTYYQRADWVVEAMTRPEAEIPDLVMWYFEEPDYTMHHHGPTSSEAVAQAERIDSVLAYFFRQIRRSPVFDRINFIVTADHGMTSLAPERYINLYPLLDTTQVIRTIPGVPMGLEVKEEYVDQAVKILRKTGRMRAWRREDIPTRYQYGQHPTRITNIVVMPDMGWTVSYSHKDHPVNKLGTHGYDNFHPDMRMVFFASGPAFRAGYRQRMFQNQNIYLLLCKLLRVEPASNDCNWMDIKEMIKD